MEETYSVIERLDQRITTLLERAASGGEVLESLRRENMMLKAENEAKSQEISKLYEEVAMKDMELEELLKKIDSFLENSSR